jgi:TrmH family RNA methyltransferase
MLVKSKVKYIQSLGQKKFREEEQVFIAEGPKIINELLAAKNIPLVSLFALGEWIDSNQSLLREFDSRQIELIKEPDLKRISFLITPNQVLGLFRKPIFPPLELKGRITLVLDNIQDPGNMGTILRIADWFGVKCIICSETSADIFNPKSVQSSMGSIGRVRVEYKDLQIFLRQEGLPPIYGAMFEGISVADSGHIREGMILIGNESKGISESLTGLIQHRITIPGTGAAESLNAAVATGILLSHLLG